MNVGGWLVLVLGVSLVVIALRGTQGQVFPWLFSSGPGTGNNRPPGDINPVDVCSGVQCPAGQVCVAIFGVGKCAQIA